MKKIVIKKRNLKKSFLVFFIGISLPLYVLWRIVLVDFEYSSIGDPESGVKVSIQEIDNKPVIIFPEEENYHFDKIELEVKLRDAPDNSGEFEISAYQNFLISFYPKSQKALGKIDLNSILKKNNETDLIPGNVFFNGDAVSLMLPNNSYKSFFSAELFEKMGYQWESVIDKKIGFSGRLEEKESFVYGMAHPDGTFVENDSQFFLVWNQELLPIEVNINIKKEYGVDPIKIPDLEPVLFDDCTTSLSRQSLVCTFQKDFNAAKSNYIFTVSDLEIEKIEEIKIRLETTPSRWSFVSNFFVRIENIKLKLIKKYRGYIPFI